MPKKTPTYQALSAQLEALLERLQDPEVQVDDAVHLYKEGLRLVAALESQLTAAENTIKRLQLQAGKQAE